LGGHVAQKGSLVNEEHLRFDFSHFAKMSPEEIAEVEELVNEKIRQNIPVVIREMPKDEALKSGAMALFGEKYGDLVRVVTIDPAYSIELCGGTHVGATGELGFFKITHETAVAAGVRRVEAVTGARADDFIRKQLSLIDSLNEMLKNPQDLSKAIENMAMENNHLKKKIEKLESRQLSQLKDVLVKKVLSVNGSSFLGEVLEDLSGDDLKKLCFDLKNELTDYCVVLAASQGGKASVVVMLDESLVKNKNLDASKIIREQVAPLIKGGGGGQKTLATAGGQDASKLDQVIEKLKSLL
jgi:alanyl-tRNA synthetase